MFASIFILSIFLPVAFISLVLDTCFSSDEVSEMGICLQGSKIMQPIISLQRYELVDTLPKSGNCEKANRLYKGLQACQ